MPTIYGSNLESGSDHRNARLAEEAGAERLGLTLYELAAGQRWSSTTTFSERSCSLFSLERSRSEPRRDGETSPKARWSRFRAEKPAHGYENRGDGIVRLLMVSEQNAPSVSVYPGTNEIGVFDAARRAERTFGARFNVADAVSDYGGGRASIVLPTEERDGA